MFDELRARSASTLADAEECLLEFIAEGLEKGDPHHIRERSKGFDLWLPWFWEVVESRRLGGDHNARDFTRLDRLYMDAAWGLVTRGILRPGPRTIEEDPGGGSYGKGFSLVEGAMPLLAHR